MSRYLSRGPLVPLVKRRAVRSSTSVGVSSRPQAKSRTFRSGSALRKFGGTDNEGRRSAGSDSESLSAAGGGVHLTTYLLLEGRCEEALAFYSASLDAEVLRLHRYKDVDRAEVPATLPAGCGDKIMHAELRIGESVLMVSDGTCSGKVSYQGFVLSLSLATADAAHRLFKALCVGGQVNLPLGDESTPSDVGMVTDRFGVRWLVSAAG